MNRKQAIKILNAATMDVVGVLGDPTDGGTEEATRLTALGGALLGQGIDLPLLDSPYGDPFRNRQKAGLFFMRLGTALRGGGRDEAVAKQLADAQIELKPPRCGNDLAAHVFDTAVSMNRALAEAAQVLTRPFENKEGENDGQG